MFKELIKKLVITVVGVFAFSNLLIVATTPHVQDVTPLESEMFDAVILSQEDSVNVVSGEAVYLGLGFQFHVEGYVNISEEDANIYFNGTTFNNSSQRAWIMVHEYAHILQKRLVAALSGGYPNETNPIQSLTYYNNLMALNAALEPYTPGWGENLHEYIDVNVSLVPYLEQNADCIVHALGMYMQEYSYIGYNWCTPEQLGAAYSIINGEWPTEERVTHYANLVENDVLDPYFDDRITVLTIEEDKEKTQVDLSKEGATGGLNEAPRDKEGSVTYVNPFVKEETESE